VVTNKILDVLITITAFIVVPLEMITTFVLGLLVRLTLGLLLFPFSFVWAVLFLFPLIGISYMSEQVKIVRWLLSILGLPLALCGDIYTSLIPSMGEMDSRIVKLLYCQTFPYTWQFHQFYGRKKPNINEELSVIFQRVSKDKAIKGYLERTLTDSSDSILRP
jgi:hypothetical protein